MGKPNILLITTDQQRLDTIHAYGNRSIYTPHMSWLADEGTSFMRCYSDSPICMAARATIMTGKHGYTHGLTGNNSSVLPMAENVTLPGALTRGGYQTRAQGKMHFHPIRANYGFESMELPLDYYRHMAEHPEYGVPKGHGVGENEIEPVISTVDEARSATYWTVKRSIDFLETRDETRPFFLWTSFAKPHPPFDCCQNYWALYQGREMPPPVMGDWAMDAGNPRHGLMSHTYVLNNGYRMSDAQKADVKRAYYACVTQIDYSMGLLFARMREMGLLEDTWIIFTTDHGDMMGDHGMFAKSVFLEGSAHIPMIVRPPRKGWTRAGGARCERLVTLADVMPTILAAAGIGGPPGMDGEDMMAIARDEAGAKASGGSASFGDGRDRPFHGNCSDETFAAIEGGYKYTWTGVNGDELMFDLRSDPHELRDLIGREPERAAEMRERLSAKVASYKPGLLKDGRMAVGSVIGGPEDTVKWPGFHSTGYPTDVLH